MVGIGSMRLEKAVFLAFAFLLCTAKLCLLSRHEVIDEETFACYHLSCPSSCTGVLNIYEPTSMHLLQLFLYVYLPVNLSTDIYFPVKYFLGMCLSLIFF